MKKLPFLLSTMAMALAADPAHAAIVIQFSEVGSDVVAAASGTFDVTGLSTNFENGIGFAPSQGNFSPSLNQLTVENGGIGTMYEGFSGPADFGTGGWSYAWSTTGYGSLSLGGNVSGITALMTTGGFGSANPLNATSTYLNSSFASLGLGLGTYVYTATNSETITVQVGPVSAAVPEPSTWAMMLAGFGAVGFAMRRRQRQRVRYSFG